MSWGVLGSTGWCRFHAFMTGTWVALIIPTVLWWRESILWVAIMSVWANIAAHFSAYQGARSERKQDDRD